MVISIGITHDIDADVRDFIDNSELKVGIYENFLLEDHGTDAIRNGAHAWALAKQINNEIGKRTGKLKRGTLHREAEFWDKTHPLEQIRWTQEKNAKCNKHYVNVVKCIKWWRKEKYPDVKHPKSYPLEHFIGDCCPDSIESVAEGIVLTLEKIVSDYPTKPILEDRGVPEHDVFGRLSDEDYEAFYDDVCEAAIIARSAYEAETVAESASLWRELFGNKFPEAKVKETVFTKRESASTNLTGGRFA